MYFYFSDLDITRLGKITNKQFIEAPWFRFNPFKDRLIDAFPLRKDEDLARDRGIDHQSPFLSKNVTRTSGFMRLPPRAKEGNVLDETDIQLNPVPNTIYIYIYIYIAARYRRTLCIH